MSDEGTVKNQQDDVMFTRLWAYGSCMVQIRICLDEVFILMKRLAGLLVAVREGKADARSINRVSPVIRYLYLNLRNVVEQVAFGMALADADALDDDRLLSWNPRKMMKALRERSIDLSYFPVPVVKPFGRPLHQSELVGLHKVVGGVLHTSNPLKMEVEHGHGDGLAVPARDAGKAMERARALSRYVYGIQNLLANHEIANSFDGCEPWRVRMCDDAGCVELSTRYRERDEVMPSALPTAFESEMHGFWQRGEEF